MSKKFLVSMIVCLMAMIGLSSCGSIGTYSIKTDYDVCYPDGTRNFQDVTLVESKDFPFVKCYSYGGTNYISIITTNFTGQYFAKEKGVEIIKSSTAPIRLNSYSPIKINKKEKKKDGVYY